MPADELIVGKSHVIFVGLPENFTPPTKNPDDCICEGAKPGSTSRRLIANCPCCDGVQILTQKICNCEEGHPMKVTLPPSLNGRQRLRYIDTIGAIA